MEQCREWVSVNDCPHGHLCGVFGGSHPILRCYPSSNSDLMREKLYFSRVARLAKSMLLSVTLEILPVFFSYELCSIILAFWRVLCYVSQF